MKALPLRLAHSIVLAWGWRRLAIAFGSGAASALAMAPFHFWPILFVTFPLLVWLIDGSAAGRGRGILAAAAAGWWFGFGYFLAGLYWVGFAFLVDADIFGWLMPFAVLSLPAGLALFTAAGTALARLLWCPGPVRILALALALTAAEWARGHVLTGFPWNAFGYALTSPLVLAQSAAVFGLWGLTLLAVAIFAAPAVLIDDPIDNRHRAFAPALALAVLVALAGYGAWRLAATPTAFVDDVRLRIMQPNLPQDQKFNYQAKQQVMSRYLALSGRATESRPGGLRDVTHLIWPESAFPFFLVREADALAQIATLLPPGTRLFTGAARPAAPGLDGRSLRAYNAIYAIDHDGTVLAVYDKLHLVPFGEYLPFQDFLERLGLMQLTKVQGGFLAGDYRRVMAVPGAPPAVPLICYEIVFPGEVDARGERGGWMLNVTNDGWFGDSTGPYQHLHQARIRAIEQGLPLVRAANTGISAVVDPVGRIIAALPLGAEGVLDAGLPQGIAPPPYLRWNGAPALILLAVAAVCVLRRRLARA